MVLIVIQPCGGSDIHAAVMISQVASASKLGFLCLRRFLLILEPLREPLRARDICR